MAKRVVAVSSMTLKPLDTSEHKFGTKEFIKFE